MSNIEISVKEANELFEAAKLFSKSKPWESLNDTNVFGIKIPEIEDTLFCSILGNGGEMYGVEIYKGAPGVDSYFKLIRKDYDLEDEIIHINYSYGIYFEDRKDISKEDYALVKHSEINFRGKKQWPRFIYSQPGFTPRNLNKEELLIMTKVLKSANEFSNYLKENMDKASLIKKGKCCIWTYDENNNSKEEIVDFEKIFQSWTKGRIIPKVFNNFDLSRLKSISKQNDSVFEIDYFYSPVPVEDKDSYYPAILAIIDTKSGAMVGSHMTHPSNMMEEFQRYVLSFFDKKKEFPKQLVISNLDILMSMEDICRGLDIKIQPIKKLKIVPIIKADYYKSLKEKLG